MRVAFCSSEVFPYTKTGGLADVCGALPLALSSIGVDVVIFQPKYRCVDEKKYGLKKIHEGFFHAKFSKNIDAYFIDCPRLYDRDGIYGDQQGDYPDNFERFDYFSRKVLELIKVTDMEIDVVHCHDWQTGLIPVYLKFLFHDDKLLGRIKTIFSIHNMAYQGLFPKEFFGKFDFACEEILQKSGMYFYGKISLLRAGIVTSDAVTTVSPQYAREIQTKEQGCGMDDVLAARKNGVQGILNGLDYSIWDPEHDGLIAQRYSDKSFDGKSVNKKEVQLLSGLPNRPEVPLFAFVGRLSHQKGVDLIAESMSALLENDIQVVFLGVGDAESQKAITSIADRYPNKVAVHLLFDEGLAHQLYAGSDFFLMPSIYEPCGLSQMISLCYGTIPIVYKTGGLADTVQDISAEGNGIVFDHYKREDFVKAVFRAIDLFSEPAQMDEVIARAFASRFSWEDSAKKYQKFYQDLVK
jgi:starch synthase